MMKKKRSAKSILAQLNGSHNARFLSVIAAILLWMAALSLLVIHIGMGLIGYLIFYIFVASIMAGLAITVFILVAMSIYYIVTTIYILTEPDSDLR